MNRISWASILNALTIGLVGGILALIVFITKTGSVFGLDVKSLVNVFAFAFFPAIATFLQSLLVSPSSGKFVGTVNVR